MKDVMILTGAGQIGMAIARRMGYGKKIVIGDKKPENAQAIAEIMNNAGFDTVAMEMDLSSRDSILVQYRFFVHKNVSSFRGWCMLTLKRRKSNYKIDRNGTV